MPTLDTFLAWYTQINKNKFASSFSPHKPLTILFALTKALKGERWIEYANERDTLEEFIWAYTNRPSRPNCLQPLWRL